MRVLSTKFMSYSVYKLKKNNNKNLLDMLDIGNLEIDKIIDLMKLGNRTDMTEEELCNKLDDYLQMSEENSYVSAYLALLEELDKDTKLLRSCGFSVKKIKQQMLDELSKEKDINESSNVVGIVDPVETDEV